MVARGAGCTRRHKPYHQHKPCLGGNCSSKRNPQDFCCALGLSGGWRGVLWMRACEAQRSGARDAPNISECLQTPWQHPEPSQPPRLRAEVPVGAGAEGLSTELAGGGRALEGAVEGDPKHFSSKSSMQPVRFALKLFFSQLLLRFHHEGWVSPAADLFG